LVTGGSGFIGTALLVSLRKAGHEVLSLDTQPPQNEAHRGIYREVNLLDAELLKRTVRDFGPSHVIHLAARTDLDGKDLDDYSANTVGVRNIVDSVAGETPVKQAIFASTKLVCRGGYCPRSDEDFCPDTLYGESKVQGEGILRSDSSLRCPWCIVRPTSIWGPWFGVPYLGLFLAIHRGYYFHLGRINPPRSFGYVGNVVFQIEKIMSSPPEMIHRKTFYLSDYDAFTTMEWANAISARLRGRPARTVPEFMMHCAALAGDTLKKLGWKNPPMTTFRLNNMRIDTTGIPLESIKHITGPRLPYTMEQGVEETIAWMKERNLIA
jgi:GlcNAc-P-P-Und epimerase